MNNSERTTIIAKGIHLWANVQNLRGSDESSPSNIDRFRWLVWASEFPEFVEFVKAEQFALFDRVNNAF